MSSMKQTAGSESLAGIPVFLTAYDPSDLPNGSVDPMGFERGYLFLADKILPGLTNAGNRPRYFGMLCAGAYLADVDPTEPPQVQYRKRLDSVLRLERFWALANVLATEENPEELPLAGLRGVQYAKAWAETLAEKGKKDSDADFKMLARQVPYGAVGIYGAVADGMRLWERSTLVLTPDLGERLAEAFIDETNLPELLKKAIREDNRSVPLAVLSAWGCRAHVCGQPGPGEAACLREALHQNPVRSRMAEILKAHPPGDASELDRLQRIARALENDPCNADLREATIFASSSTSGRTGRRKKNRVAGMLWLNPLRVFKVLFVGLSDPPGQLALSQLWRNGFQRRALLATWFRQSGGWAPPCFRLSAAGSLRR